MKNERIYVHCSASEWGNAKEIDEWHKARGFSSLGYHWVILNGKETRKSLYDKSLYDKSLDGATEEGRDEGKRGAHVGGHNTGSIGICLIGNPKYIGDLEAFTNNQLNELRILIHTLIIKEEIEIDQVYGHNEVSNKICPGFNVRLWWDLAKHDKDGVEV